MLRKMLTLVISLAALVAVPAGADATVTSATCPANAYECNTGIEVQPGDTIVATASPDFSICGGVPGCFMGQITPVSAEEAGSGYIAQLSFQYSYYNGALVYGYDSGGFYRIGPSGYWTAFIAGENPSISEPVVATSSGLLYVTTNDLYWYYGDNAGSISVTVTSPPPLPIHKAQCKHGGWRTFGVFKNQGDCVSYVATDGKNEPSGA